MAHRSTFSIFWNVKREKKYTNTFLECWLYRYLAFTERKIGIFRACINLARVDDKHGAVIGTQIHSGSSSSSGGMGSFTKCHVERQTKLLSFRWYEIVTTFRSQQIETNGNWICYHYSACHEITTRNWTVAMLHRTFRKFATEEKKIWKLGARKKENKNTRKVVIVCIMCWQGMKIYANKWMLFVSINGIFSIEMRYTLHSRHNEVKHNK